VGQSKAQKGLLGYTVAHLHLMKDAGERHRKSRTRAAAASVFSSDHGGSDKDLFRSDFFKNFDNVVLLFVI